MIISNEFAVGDIVGLRGPHLVNNTAFKTGHRFLIKELNDEGMVTEDLIFGLVVDKLPYDLVRILYRRADFRDNQNAGWSSSNL